ncbi:MAG: hypothetical protein Kow00111_28750 [Thermincola ferriacetica]
MINIKVIKRFLFVLFFLFFFILVAYDMMEPLAQDFTPNDTLDIIMKAFGEMNVDELPVVNNRLERKLIGIIHKKDVIDAYNKEILKRDMVSSVSSYISSLAQFKQIAKQLNVKCKRGNETGRL